MPCFAAALLSLSLALFAPGLTLADPARPALAPGQTAFPGAAPVRVAQLSSPLSDRGLSSGRSAGAGATDNPLGALQALGKGLLGSREPDFLDPDQAFLLEARVVDENRVALEWIVAPGYYLYRKRFGVSVREPPGVSVAELALSQGVVKQDEYFGEVEVYYQAAIAEVMLRRAPASSQAQTLVLDVRYQGCADAGLCYPPITRQVELRLPPGGGAGLAAGPGGRDAAPAAVAGGAAAFTSTELPVAASVVSQKPAATGGARRAVASGDSNAGRWAASNGPAPSADGVARPALLTANTATSGPSVAAPEQDRIAAALSGESVPWVLLSFLGFGLLLTFTPCVLPMIPILAGIIAGQGDNLGAAKAFRLSLVYVLAMAAAYTAAGVAAGLSGSGLQAAFQNPWVLSGFAAVFVLLALSMFGFYALQVPAAVQARLAAFSNRQRGGTYLGAGLMGLLSALIVGPCIAPPLAGALIYIGQTGDAVLGGAALFALSMGMGAPLLVVGTSAGKLIPRAGRWMETVKAAFGVILLGVAIFLLERVVADWVALLLWATLFIIVAIYMGALDSLPAGGGGWHKLRKGSGLAMLLYGVMLMAGAAIGNGTLQRPLQGLALGGGGHSGELAFAPVKGPDGLEVALRRAQATGQPAMLDYYADWCVSCKEMEQYTFADARVRAALEHTMLLQTDVTANDTANQALLERFGLFGPPAILFFGPDGRERPEFRVVGFMDAVQFEEVVRRATMADGLAGSAATPRASVALANASRAGP